MIKFLITFLALASSVGNAFSIDAHDEHYNQLKTSTTMADKRLLSIVDNEQKLFNKFAKDPEQFTQADMDFKVHSLISQYELYITDNNKDIKGYIFLGKLLRNVNRADRAHVIYQQAEKIDGNVAVIHQQIGNYLAETGEIGSAYQSLKKAVKLDSRKGIYHYQVGTFLHFYKREIIAQQLIAEGTLKTEIYEAFKKAHQLDSEQREFTERFAQAHYDIDSPDWEKALSLWQQLISSSTLDEEKEAINLHQARVNLELGHFDKAENIANKITLNSLQPSKKSLLSKIEANRSQPRKVEIVAKKEIKEEAITKPKVTPSVVVENAAPLEKEESLEELIARIKKEHNLELDDEPVLKSERFVVAETVKKPKIKIEPKKVANEDLLAQLDQATISIPETKAVRQKKRVKKVEAKPIVKITKKEPAKKVAPKPLVKITKTKIVKIPEPKPIVKTAKKEPIKKTAPIVNFKTKPRKSPTAVAQKKQAVVAKAKPKQVQVKKESKNNFKPQKRVARKISNQSIEAALENPDMELPPEIVTDDLPIIKIKPIYSMISQKPENWPAFLDEEQNVLDVYLENQKEIRAQLPQLKREFQEQFEILLNVRLSLIKRDSDPELTKLKLSILDRSFNKLSIKTHTTFDSIKQLLENISTLQDHLVLRKKHIDQSGWNLSRINRVIGEIYTKTDKLSKITNIDFEDILTLRTSLMKATSKHKEVNEEQKISYSKI